MTYEEAKAFAAARRAVVEAAAGLVFALARDGKPNEAARVARDMAAWPALTSFLAGTNVQRETK